MKKRSVYPYVILFIIAVLVLVVAYFIRPSTVSLDDFIYNITLNGGYIIITIVIVNGLWFLLGGDPIKNSIDDLMRCFHFLADGLKNGLSRYFVSNADFSQVYKWSSVIKKASKNIDMMGYSLHAWTKSQEMQNALIKLAKHDVKIRIMVMDVTNQHFTAGLNFSLNSFTEQYMKDEVALCSTFYANIQNALPPEKKGNIELHTIKTGLTQCQIIRIDNVMYVTPYLYSQNTDTSPVFVLKNSDEVDTFDKYHEEFNMLWRMNP